MHLLCFEIYKWGWNLQVRLKSTGEVEIYRWGWNLHTSEVEIYKWGWNLQVRLKSTGEVEIYKWGWNLQMRLKSTSEVFDVKGEWHSLNMLPTILYYNLAIPQSRGYSFFATWLLCFVGSIKTRRPFTTNYILTLTKYNCNIWWGKQSSA
jgi:hypothetical protein